jgi:hypothetical protein
MADNKDKSQQGKQDVAKQGGAQSQQGNRSGSASDQSAQAAASRTAAIPQPAPRTRAGWAARAALRLQARRATIRIAEPGPLQRRLDRRALTFDSAWSNMTFIIFKLAP